MKDEWRVNAAAAADDCRLLLDMIIIIFYIIMCCLALPSWPGYDTREEMSNEI